MKIRFALLSLLGVAVYILLASYNSRMLKEIPLPGGQTSSSAVQAHPEMKAASEKALAGQHKETAASAAPAAQPSKTTAPAVQLKEIPAPSALQLSEQMQQPAAEAEQLRAELAERDQQIRQLVDAQESIAAKYRALIAQVEAGSASSKDTTLQAGAERIKELAEAKEQATKELDGSRMTITQLNAEIQALKEAGVLAEQRLKAQTDEAAEIAARFAEAEAKLTAKAGKIEQMATSVKEKEETAGKLEQRLQEQTAALQADVAALTRQADEAKAETAKAALAAQEKDTAVAAMVQQLHERAAEADGLKAQLADTASRLEQMAAVVKEKESAASRAEQMLQEGSATFKTELADLTAKLATATAEQEKTTLAAKEKEVASATMEQQLKERTDEVSGLQVKLDGALAQLASTRTELAQEQQKATGLLQSVQEKDTLLTPLEEQKTTLEKSLQEKTEELAKAVFTIQALKQEAAAQPQAAATIQSQLDERTRECEQLKQESGARFEQLNAQVGALTAKENKSAEALNSCRAEAETALKRVAEMESSQVLTQTSLAARSFSGTQSGGVS